MTTTATPTPIANAIARWTALKENVAFEVDRIHQLANKLVAEFNSKTGQTVELSTLFSTAAQQLQTTKKINGYKGVTFSLGDSPNASRIDACSYFSDSSAIVTYKPKSVGDLTELGRKFKKMANSQWRGTYKDFSAALDNLRLVDEALLQSALDQLTVGAPDAVPSSDGSTWD